MDFFDQYLKEEISTGVLLLIVFFCRALVWNSSIACRVGCLGERIKRFNVFVFLYSLVDLLFKVFEFRKELEAITILLFIFYSFVIVESNGCYTSGYYDID